MTDFKNPQDASGSRWERHLPLKHRALQAVGVLLLTSSAAMAAPKTIYVNGTRTASGDGTSWATAYRYLRDALAVSAPGDSLYITKGTYKPDDSEVNLISPAGSFKGDRDASFNLNGVNVYGGFAGTETDPGSRPQDFDPNKNSQTTPGGVFIAALTEANRTILSGDILPGRVAERSLHVIRMTSNSTLDRVTVEKGLANGREFTNDQGGGCFASPGTTLTLNQSEFRDNSSYDSGGAIWGTVVVTMSRFAKNIVVPQSVYNYQASGGAIKGTVTATDSTFISNSVTSQSLDARPDVTGNNGGNTTAEGGAIAGSVIARNCEFISNIAKATAGGSFEATARGGALSGFIKVSKCRFTLNSVTGTGGLDARYVSSGGAISGQFTAESCAFVSNFASAVAPELTNATPPDPVFGGGGALCTLNLAAPSLNKSEVNNCVFSLNTSLVRGGAIHATKDTDLKIQNSTFVNNGVAGVGTRGAALCCGGVVTILNNIFWFTDVSVTVTTPVAATYNLNKLIRVLGLGEIKVSGSDNPSVSTISRNVVPPGAPTTVEDPGSYSQQGTVLASIFPTAVIFEGAGGTPAFPAELEGPDKTWGTVDDRLRLLPPNPPSIPVTTNLGVIDKGQIRYMSLDSLDIDGDGNFAEQIPADIAGFTRVQGTDPDIGAYESGPLTHAPEISIEYTHPQPQRVLVDNEPTTVNLTAFAGVEKTFEIKNLGPANLNRLAVSVTGANVADFVVTQPLTPTVLPLGKTTFTVKFAPKTFGSRTATIIVSNDDANENPFDIKVEGSVEQPEIDIQQTIGTPLVSATAEVDFGLVGDLSTTSKIFTVFNRGSANMTLSAIRFEGANASDFTASAPGSTALAPGASTTFTVNFKPGAGGLKNAVVLIPSNDVDENPFAIKVKGTAPLAEIAVAQADGVNIVDAISSFDYGRTGYLAKTVKTFTILNSGVGHLTVQGITSSGANASDFVVSAPVSSVVLTGKSTTFTVSFTPSATGQRTAQISIKNDDPDDESTFTFAVTGSALLTPKMAVKQPFLPDLVDGSFSNFGSVQKGLLYTKKFVIRNDGIGVLKGISVSLTGSNTFTKTNPSVTVLKTGESTSFKVTFKPGKPGMRAANIRISSNDPANPLNISLSGKATAKKKKKSTLAENLLFVPTTASAAGSVSVTASDEGSKYLTLSLNKVENADAVASDVEVSSDLLDWYSGSSYTTTLVDSETLLKVRDDVPVKTGEKRYIRLKPASH
jgi:predicted outer membrane repeat protein